MSKITLTNLVNLQNETTAVNAINNNNTVLTTALDNTISRDGTSPNAMNASLDMNGNHIINLPAPLTANEPLRLTDVVAGTVIPNLGTMALQNANTVIITGGTVAGTALSSTVTGATAAPGDNTTKLATTSFVTNATAGAAAPATVIPLVASGTGAVGTSLLYARQDHVHPAPALALPIVNTATAVSTTTISSSITGFITLGYYSVGDGGNAIYKKVGGATTGGLVSLDGANWQVFPEGTGAYTPEMFGAKGDGVTDDTTALQNAINVTPMGGRLTNGNPNAVYAISTTISITKPIHMIFSPSVSILPLPAVGASVVLYFTGNANGITVPTIIENLYIGSTGANTRNGTYGMFFDTTTAGTYFRGLEIRNVTIKAGTRGYYGLAMLNNTVNNPNGGVYCSSIRGGVIEGGLYFGGTGDNIVVRDALVPWNSSVGSDNLGIYVGPVSGGGSFKLEHVNFSQPGGCVIDGGYSVTIEGCQFEGQAVSTESNGAIVDIKASSTTVAGLKFRNNQVQAIAGIGTPLLLRIGANVTTIIVDGNNFATPTGYTGVNNNCADLRLGPNFWSTSATHVSGTAASVVYGGG